MILYYVVHSFTDTVFRGNPAGVCPLEEWLDDELMQRIAAENRLSETAFFVRKKDHFELRWFTPVIEVDLCGHATLASAYVLFDHLGHDEDVASFHTRSGELTVRKDGNFLVMDFPSRPGEPIEAPEALIEGLGSSPEEVYLARDYLAIFESEQDIRNLKPDFAALETLDCEGVIASAPGNDADFVSRFFAPKMGIPEDPVTGSAHSTLTPFWASRLEKKQLVAHQVSERGGVLKCTLRGDRVLIAGQAVLYVKGFLSTD
jgi:PhzF family phenazine biosynthesis protein